MDEAAGWTAIKRGVHRSVFRVEPADGGATRLVKRFRAEGALRRLFDGARARREARVLGRLRAAGVPVPEVLGLRRGGEGWELWCEWIGGARTLAQLVEGAEAWPRAPRELAGELGRVLARAQRAGLVHADLHPGNVLVDGRGGVWLVDFTRARMARRVGRERAECALVRLESELREMVPFSLRARCLRGWLEAWSGIGREEAAAMAERVAALGRVDRRQRVARERDRWLRESSRCVRGDAGLVRRGAGALAPEELAALERASDGARVRARGEAGAMRESVVRAGRKVREDWGELGRAADHHLPGAKPLALRMGVEARALFEVAAGARVGAGLGEASARAVGALVGALFDRGLTVAGDVRASLFVAENGSVGLGPGVRLGAWDVGDVSELATGWMELCEARDGARRASFVRGFVGALRRDWGRWEVGRGAVRGWHARGGAALGLGLRS